MNWKVLFLLALVEFTSADPFCPSCLKYCKRCDRPSVDAILNCPLRGYDCDEEHDSEFFEGSNGDNHKDCDSLTCPSGFDLFVRGKKQVNLACKGRRWYYSYDYQKKTKSAVCAKKCTGVCSFSKPETAPSDSIDAVQRKWSKRFGCPVAYCPTGYAMKGDLDKDIVGDVVCKGNGKWKDAKGAEYEKIHCEPSTGGSCTCSKPCPLMDSVLEKQTCGASGACSPLTWGPSTEKVYCPNGILMKTDGEAAGFQWRMEVASSFRWPSARKSKE